MLAYMEYGSAVTYIGVPVPRREDADLLRGAAKMVADLRLPDTVELAFARASAAHARLIAVDAAPARGLPGVVGAWSAADLPDLPPAPAPFESGAPFGGPDRFPLARDVVRFAGEPVAVVAAPRRAQAEDGAERVLIELQPLPPLLTAEAATGPDAAALFPGRSNIVTERDFGQPADDVFAQAPVVVKAAYRQQLLIPTSLEGRAVLARADDDGGFTIWVSHQAQHQLRAGLATVFGLEADQVRVIVPVVGGAFGAKSGGYPEYVLAAYLARLLGRPVRWVEDRAEALATSTRGRGQDQQARIAATEDGRLLAYELRVQSALGAYPHTGDPLPMETGAMSTGCYWTPRVYAHVRTVLANTPPLSAYRGAGRPEATFAIERTMDQLARRLGIDPVELRRRNFIRDFPYRTPTGRLYDSGNYEATLDKALEVIGYAELRAEQRRRRDGTAGRGWRPLGIGVICYVERSGGPDYSDEFGSVEVGADGSVLARSGSTNTGQAHPTTFPQVVATALEISLDRVRLVQNDTREVPYGFASFGSRSMQVGGTALWRASEKLIDEARRRFAAACEVGLSEVSYARGLLRTGSRSVALEDLVRQTGPLRTEDRFASPQAFPFGCHAVVLEVDTELGTVDVLRLVAVDDYGVVVNPMVVNGQGYGSIAQGFGQVMFEEARYAADGTPAAVTLLEYLLPTAADIPPVELYETETRNPNTPVGAKGAGEAGCIGIPPAVVGAVCDALDIDHIDMPLTPEAVWRAARRG
jgi:aerobic carbon-monoxide dehydrogenase large subunit